MGSGIWVCRLISDGSRVGFGLVFFLSFLLCVQPLLHSHSGSWPQPPPGSQPRTSVSGVTSGSLLHNGDRDTADPVTDPFPISRLCLQPFTQPLAPGAQATLRSSFSVSPPEFRKLNSMCLPYHKTVSSIRRETVYVLVITYTQYVK